MAEELRQHGLPVIAAGEDAVLELGDDRLTIRRGRPGSLTVEPAGAAARTPAADGDPIGTGTMLRLVAIGLATVDHVRLARELGVAPMANARDESRLGARAWAVPGTRIRLLEPSTEGPLAASLARLGEGPIVLYLERRGPPAAEHLPPPPVPHAGTLIRPDRAWGPFVILEDVQAR